MVPRAPTKLVTPARFERATFPLGGGRAGYIWRGFPGSLCQSCAKCAAPRVFPRPQRPADEPVMPPSARALDSTSLPDARSAWPPASAHRPPAAGEPSPASRHPAPGPVAGLAASTRLPSRAPSAPFLRSLWSWVHRAADPSHQAIQRQRDMTERIISGRDSQPCRFPVSAPASRAPDPESWTRPPSSHGRRQPRCSASIGPSRPRALAA